MRQKQKTPDTQQQILKAALHCFAASGYAGATLTEIRHRAGVSVGSLYHWFASKEELGIALYLEGLRDYQAGLLAILGAAPAPAPGVRGLVAHHLTWVEQHPAWAQHLLNMRQAEFLAGAREEIERMNRTLFVALRRWLKPHLAAGTMEQLPLELFVATVMGPAQEFVRMWLAGRARTPMKLALRTLADAAWRSVRGERR